MRIGNVRFFHKSHDGGSDSGVTGYWLIECKWLFSIVLLRFNEGSREAFHTHAFNALTFWLKGNVTESFTNGTRELHEVKYWKAGDIKFTPKNNFHKITCTKPAWALCFRGRWDKTWQEHKGGELLTLGHGRVRIDTTKGV